MNHYEMQNKLKIATKEEPLFGSMGTASFDAQNASQIRFGLESLEKQNDSLGFKVQESSKSQINEK